MGAVIDFSHITDYNNAIFYERMVNTMTISIYYIPTAKHNIIDKHGVCPIYSAMC